MVPDPSLTIDATLGVVRRQLAAAGIDSAAVDARLLVREAIGASPTDLILCGGEPLGDAAAGRLAELLPQRLAREPMARILGRQEFFGLSFLLSPATLVPRPDTETLVETCLDLVRGGMLAGVGPSGEGLSFADIGTGSGAILVALLHALPGAHGVGIDLSTQALATAEANAAANGVDARCSFVATSYLEGIGGPFDFIVSNPPYIEAGVIDALEPEVAQHEPKLALDGGADGLDAYRAICKAAPSRLKPGGFLAVEIGFDQAETVSQLFDQAGFRDIALHRDLAGRARVVCGRL
ncbi:Release factor glutamine methyltransferase [Hartmannibacter diazotrophicus]|uniref:Release factor glutamine methyltransferase n=1 Tax=Hartmannibacter diazotrophicus TaxID=1482074 RepID=A0A2C9DAZ8_9HYPH|nr:peptide chain release factor N(5)-glutamine methyltransferase [Hartmannibacter diazotrophicus]SON57308.1 Release factor glutamine methyltransferase [Hartmannibacter diazotrophicus]